MCNDLIKFYQRESQADLDCVEMTREGWRKTLIRYCHAARMWEVTYSRPASISAIAEIAAFGALVANR